MLADVANSTIPDTFAADGSILTYKKILGADMGEGNTSTTLPVTAANITISKELSKDSSYLIYDKKSKDNTYILSMIQQFTTDKHQFETTGDRFTGTFEDFINDYNSTLGSDINHCTTRMDASTTMLTEIMNTRDSVSGVSESEETANMLMYNRSFQAASRMLNTMDGLLDVIINKMGV
jgi:flagellar hook-associated protein 1 FlgK